jgi:alpha-glucosidase
MFRFAQNDSAWWIPSDEFAYESLYRKNSLSEINEAATPLTVETADGKYLCLHEAALYNYSEMYLQNAGTGTPDFFAGLWPDPDSICARVTAPFSTPWRCVIIANDAPSLMESHLVQNLNEPCKIEDVSWIKPLKFVGIWWGLHLGKQTWYAGENHGATTVRTKEYADFAAKHNIGGVLAEGWNLGWETWASGVEAKQDFCTAYPDFNLEEVVEYCKSNNVEFVAHHETGGNIPEYEKQLEKALKLCNKLGIHYLKTGYAGPIIPEGYHHHGQFMVNHFQKVVEMAAKYQICLDVHESIKPTGIDRTWPNLMSQEAARGNEWNATYKATPPYHATILPFTRFVAGPYDYTPGIFNINHSPESNKRLYCTRSYQMALFVVFFSPMMMVSDMIENYKNQPEFKFLEQVPCTWDKTDVLSAVPGDFVCVARKSGEVWFVGTVSDENCRMVKIPLSFLDKGKDYVAEIYCDDISTNWETNPNKVEIASYKVISTDTIYAAVAKAGGNTVILRPAKPEDKNLVGISANNKQAKEKMIVFEKQKTYGVASGDHLAVGKNVKLSVPYSQKYPASGANALTDGKRGNHNLNENWQGFEGTDVEITIDLGEIKKIKSVKTSFLDSPNDWIFYPQKLEFLFSEDGNSYKSQSQIPVQPTLEKDSKITSIQELGPDNLSISTRYIKIKISATKTCPDWHYGKGKKAWLFCDEVVVE